MAPIRQFATVFGIAVIFPALIYYGVRAYQPLPAVHYTAYVSVRLAPTTSEGWKAWEEEDRARQKKQQEDFDAVDKAAQPFYRALILVSTLLGTSAILIGSLLKFSSVGTGLVAGGIASIANGYLGYWNHLDDTARLTLLSLLICLLIFVGYQVLLARNNPS